MTFNFLSVTDRLPASPLTLQSNAKKCHPWNLICKSSNCLAEIYYSLSFFFCNTTGYFAALLMAILWIKTFILICQRLFNEASKFFNLNFRQEILLWKHPRRILPLWLLQMQARIWFIWLWTLPLRKYFSQKCNGKKHFWKGNAFKVPCILLSRWSRF